GASAVVVGVVVDALAGLVAGDGRRRVGLGLELADDLLDLEAGARDALAAQAQQLGSPADPGAEDVDVDLVVVDLVEDLLELPQGVRVAQLRGARLTGGVVCHRVLPDGGSGSAGGSV